MWYANLTRREVMDALVTGWRPVLSKMKEEEIPSFSENSSYLVVWLEESASGVDSLPCLIASNEKSVGPFLAALISAPHLPFPVTSFSRILSADQLSSFALRRDSDCRAALLNGLACLAIAEASIYAGQDSQSDGIGASVCGRTISHAFGKAIQAVPVGEIEEFLRRWVEVQAIASANSWTENGISGTLARIFDVCVSIDIGEYGGDILVSLVHDAAKYGEPTDASWQAVTGAALDGMSLQKFSSGTREERGIALQDILEDVAKSKNPSEDLLAACALVATRISPGTLDHLNLLLRGSNPRVALWYSFFAGIQRFGSALRQRQGRGLRILRDMKISRRIYSEPRADIAYDEFILATKFENESMSKRLTHSNEIVVELYPYVDVSFRYGKRADRGSTSGSQSSDAARQGLANEILSAAKSLESIAAKVLGAGKNEATATRAKGGRQKRLL